MAEQMEAPVPTEQSAPEEATSKQAGVAVDPNAPSGKPSEGASSAAHGAPPVQAAAHGAPPEKKSKKL